MTLQLDGTKKKFNEYGAYQVTLNNASGQKETYSLGMKEMLKGDTDSFIDTMLSVFRDLAETFSDDSEQINEIRTKMLANIKNLMTDRHIVNKSFKIKFEELRAELFDKYLKNFSTLSNQSKNQVVELHSLFCALHVIGNMGTVASKALKVYESIVLPPENKITEHSFDKGNARTFDLIFELSQSLTISGSQRFGRFTDWEAFLEERNIHNFLVSFLRHRFNILFVNGGAAFYHREHIAEFFHCLTAPNKLMKCISESIISPVCVAECRALGIFGVLISQPLWKIVERDIHVLDLNPYWLKLKNALSEYSVDASNLLKGKQLFSEFAMQEDEVYVSLFVPLTDEIQKFTQECLQIICFHVLQLVNRQLMDQLPNGLYFNATDTVRNETQSCPTTNRLGEKDFSDLDREVNRAPQRNTSNISGIICFRNNNAWKFYRNMNPEKRKLCLKRALRLAPKRYSKNKAHRKQLKKKRYQFIMEKKSKRQEADNKKQKQILEISEHVKENGLWNSKTIKQNIQSIDSTNAKIKSVKQQLKYHQTILHSKADKTLFLYSVNGKPHSLEQLIQNLNQVITFETNNEELEEISSSINANTKFRCESQRKLLINNITILIRF
ncbi:hypothetical protein SNE40_002782 [Patella caerulea]|uniref:Uncharacterized protein n=1 Tax=Patella caerulea TaxID=87958 RepID=A0AAN8K6U4_PATCE